MKIRFDLENPYSAKFCRYNVPYGDSYDDGYESGKSNGYYKAKREFDNMFDIPNQNNLPLKSKLCGYIEIDGTYHECNSCEHEKIIRQLIWENEDFRKRYFDTPASFYDRMPRGMLQEEYFAMKLLGFIKISSFEKTPNKKIVFSYGLLTYKQTDLIYPR